MSHTIQPHTDMEKAHSTHEIEHDAVGKTDNEPVVILTEEDVSSLALPDAPLC